MSKLRIQKKGKNLAKLKAYKKRNRQIRNRQTLGTVLKGQCQEEF